jgi:hypothetical protein
MELTREDLLRILRDDSWPYERRVAAAREILRRGLGATDAERTAYDYAVFICDAADMRELLDTIFRFDLSLSDEKIAALSDDDLLNAVARLRRLLTDRQ